MTFNEFNKLVKTLKSFEERRKELQKLDVDLLEYDAPLWTAFKILLVEVYGESGYDWFTWFIWERDFGKRTDLTATDENGKAICRTVRELWQYLEEGRKS